MTKEELKAAYRAAQLREWAIQQIVESEMVKAALARQETAKAQDAWLAAERKDRRERASAPLFASAARTEGEMMESISGYDQWKLRSDCDEYPQEEPEEYDGPEEPMEPTPEGLRALSHADLERGVHEQIAAAWEKERAEADRHEEAMNARHLLFYAAVEKVRDELRRDSRAGRSAKADALDAALRGGA